MPAPEIRRGDMIRVPEEEYGRGVQRLLITSLSSISMTLCTIAGLEIGKEVPVRDQEEGGEKCFRDSERGREGCVVDYWGEAGGEDVDFEGCGGGIWGENGD